MSNNPPNSHTETASHDLEPALLAELTRALLPYLGPYSITTVKRAGRLSRDPDEVIRNIASHIEEPGKRELFGKSAQRILKQYQQSSPLAAQAVINLLPATQTAPTPTAPIEIHVKPSASLRGTTPVTAELMQRGEAALATIIGPLAGVLVQRYARTTDNSRDFFERLAAHLRTQEERDSFFESVRTRNGLLRSLR